MTILDGKALSTEIKEQLKQTVEQLRLENKKVPHLAAILVGDDGASQTYVNAKIKACKSVGYESTLVRLSSNVPQDSLLEKIQELNTHPEIDGFIVQLPLPKHIDVNAVIQQVEPSKDVDGFHPENFGKMAQQLDGFVSATPLGILKLLEKYQIETSGKHCVVIGRSNIVGKPMSILMSRNAYPGNATVTLCHSRSTNLENFCRQADILISAVGKPGTIKSTMVKPGAVVVDVGITRVADPSKKSGFRLRGDVDYENVSPLCSYITPVPGGVGPMTITSLLLNTLKACHPEA